MAFLESAAFGSLASGALSGIGSIASSLINANSSARNAQAQAVYQGNLNAQTNQYARDAADIAWERDLHSMELQDLRNKQNTERAYEVQQGLFDQSKAFAREQTAEQERYNTQMANTVYQRGVNDMRAAGVNPMLAIMRGGDPAASISPQPASAAGVANAPGAAAVSAPKADVAGPGSAQMATLAPFGNFIASALEGYQTAETIRAIGESIKKTGSETSLNNASAEVARQEAALKAAGTAKVLAEANEVHPSASARQGADNAAAAASRAAAGESGSRQALNEWQLEQNRKFGRGPASDVYTTVDKFWDAVAGAWRDTKAQTMSDFQFAGSKAQQLWPAVRSLVTGATDFGELGQAVQGGQAAARRYYYNVNPYRSYRRDE